jgi:hypothetical protein
MPYESNIRGRSIINEINAHLYADPSSTPDGMSRGYIPRDYQAFPAGTFAATMPLPTIPRSEWRDRIEQMDREKRWPKDHKLAAGFDSLDQNGTNYCWINGPTQCIHYVRAMQGETHVALSPASVGAPIKNYRNQGGWGSEGVKYMVEHGIAPQSLWPANAIDRKYDTEECRVERLKYKVDEWWELKERSFDQLMTCLLLGYPVAVGYSWWGHEVTACMAAIQGSDDFFIDIDNSWGKGWKDNGHTLLTESKATPDDAVVPRVVIT